MSETSSETPLSEGARPSYADERFVESLFDGVKFSNLLHLAEAVCLREPIIRSESIAPLSNEAAVVAMLGTRGLRRALEYKHGVYYDIPARAGSVVINGDRDDIDILKRPDYFNGPLDRNLLQDATSFGEAIVSEFYGILGSDADAQAEKFKNAQSVDEQVKIMYWLDHRLKKLAYSLRGLEEDGVGSDDEKVYHPARLSPKLIGSYPKHKLSPTCLGVAAAAAGFMKQAGAEFMHAGVMETARQAEILDTIYMTRGVNELFDLLGVSGTDGLEDRLSAKRSDLINTYAEDIGTHSALVVRLIDGTWLQFDSNLRSTMRFPLTNGDVASERKYSNDVQSIYDELVELRDVAPGLELGYRFPRYSAQTAWPEYIKGLSIPEDLQTRLVDLLTNGDAESIPDKVRHIVVDEWLLQDVDNPLHKWLQDQYLDNVNVPTPTGERELAIDSIFYDAFQSFVLYGMEIDEWLARCASDANFLNRRVDDIRRLPILMGIQYSLLLLNEKRAMLHSKMEFGLPETSIGLSVLNNIAIFMDDSLSVHHWLSQWSSYVVLSDKIGHASRSNAQDSVLINNLASTLNGLRYASNNDILYSFLDVRARFATEND